MPNLVGIDDDYGDDILARDAVLASMASSGFSGALAQGGIWPPLDDSRRPRLTLQRRRNQLRVVPVGVERSTLDALMPVMERLAELMSMPRGWNSYDANPISGTALRRTIEFLLEHVAFGIDHPAVVPTQDVIDREGDEPARVMVGHEGYGLVSVTAGQIEEPNGVFGSPPGRVGSCACMWAETTIRAAMVGSQR